MLYSSLLYLHHFRMLRLLLLLEFLHHLAIAVAEQALYYFILQKPREVNLVSMLLVPMPGGLYLGMVLTEFEGIVGMAFHRYPSGRSKSRQANILPKTLNTNVVSSKGKSSVTRGRERQYSRMVSMFITFGKI